MITQLKTRYEQVCAAAGTSAEGADLTVVFDAGQNSDANFAHLAQAGLSYVGSVPASDCPDRTAPWSIRTGSAGCPRTTPAATSTAPGAAPSSPTPRNCTTARPSASTAPPWPGPAGSCLLYTS